MEAVITRAAATDQSLDAQQEELYAHGDGRVDVIHPAGVHVELSAQQVSQQPLLGARRLSLYVSSSSSSSSSCRLLAIVVRLNCITSIMQRTYIHQSRDVLPSHTANTP